MKRSEILHSLEIVKPGIANKDTIEQSDSFAFHDGRVATFNDIISISHPYDGIQFDGVIRANEIYQWLTKIKKEDIVEDIQENEIILKAGRSKIGIPFQSELALPLDAISGDIGKWFKIPDGMIEKMVLVSNAAGTDMSKAVTTCVHINNAGFVEATDEFSISHYTVEGKMSFKTFLIPASSVKEIGKINPTHVSVGKNWAHFKNKEGTIISGRIYFEPFPDTSKVLNQTKKGVKIIFPRSIAKAVDKATIFAKRDHALNERLEFMLNEHRILISSESDSGWFEEELNTKYTGKELNIAVTPYLLRDIFSKTLKGYMVGRALIFSGDDWIYMFRLRES